ncbi:MAG: DUF4340 domain-containing protein [Chloroflexota bacterium]
MIKRHHQILAALLVAQLVLTVAVLWPRPTVAGQQEPLFPDLDVEDVIGLTIEDAAGSSVTLERVDSDWVLPDAGSYLARAEAVDSFVEKLTNLQTGRLVTTNDTSHRRLQVASGDFARRIVFETNDGTENTIYLGSSPQYGSVHFRPAGQSETYLTSELAAWDANPAVSTWISTSYQSVAQADVTRMTLENTHGEFVFEREDEETWSLVEPALEEGESLDQTQVRAVLLRAASVTKKKPLGKEPKSGYGMEEPSAVVTLETEDETITLRVGAEDPDEASYVVKSSESDYYVLVATTSVSALVESGKDAFLQEPTPQPNSGDS